MIWLKHLRLYLLRRQLKSVRRRIMAFGLQPITLVQLCDRKADLIGRIAELEKSL